MQEQFDFYTTRQAAEKLGVTIKRINQLVHGAWKDHVLTLPGNKRITAQLIERAVVDTYKTSLLHQTNGRTPKEK